MAVKISSVLNDQQFNSNGVMLSGGKIETYLAGSTTPATTYTSDAGTTAQPNPIILNTRGEVPNLIYLTTGVKYKFLLKDSANNLLRTYDNIEGVNDSASSIDQWVNTSVSPTYINATQFSLAGDQTSVFQVGRRVKISVTAGTVYGYIAISAYTTLTTVTVFLDSGVLDSGISSVQLGLISPNNGSLPTVTTPAQFDVSTKIATTGFVQKAIGSHSNILGVGTNITLTNTAIGQFLVYTAGCTATLPLAASGNAGSVISFLATANGCIVARQSTNNIVMGGITLTSVTLNGGDTLELVSNGTDWYVKGGSASLINSAVFNSALTASGYQKLPSGLIYQWGTTTSSATADVAVTYPIAFPSASVYSVQVSASSPSGTSAFANYNSPTSSTFNIAAYNLTGARVAIGVTWLILGK